MDKNIEYILEYDFTTNVDGKYKITCSNKEYLDNENVEEALQLMSYAYDLIKYTGYMDGHHYMITSVVNLATNHELLEDEIDDMYYHAFQPECIGFRLTEFDEFIDINED